MFPFPLMEDCVKLNKEKNEICNDSEAVQKFITKMMLHRFWPIKVKVLNSY